MTAWRTHARRKLYDLHEANKSELAAKALSTSAASTKSSGRPKTCHQTNDRQETREAKARAVANTLHLWMLAYRQKVPGGSGTAKELDYSVKRWNALTRYLDNGLRSSIKTGWITRSGPGRWAVPTGCSRGRCAVASVRRPS